MTLAGDVVSVGVVWPSVDIGRLAPFLHREVGGGALLLLGVRGSPAMKKEKLL